jgi:hypothetical protein
MRIMIVYLLANKISLGNLETLGVGELGEMCRWVKEEMIWIILSIVMR